MTKEQEILDFLEDKMFKPILESTSASERFKKATRGLRLRMKQRDAQGMIQYFWSTVADANVKHATFARILRNEGHPEFDAVVNEFRVHFKEL